MLSLETWPNWMIALNLLFGTAFFFISKFFIKRSLFHRSLNYPVASTNIPVIGAAIAFGAKGLQFLKEQKDRLGNVFLVDLVLLKFHFVLGAECTQKFYKAPNEELDFLAGVPMLLPELVEDAWDIDPSFQAKGHQLALKGFSQKDRLDHAHKLLIEETDLAIIRWQKMDKINIFEECNRLTVLVTLRFILGDDICKERGDELADMYDQLERDLADPLVMTLRPLPTTPYRRLIHIRNALLGIIRECVDKMVKAQQSGDNYVDDGSFLAMLMKELGPQYWYQYGYLCLGIILATRTNTAGVLAWTFAHLCDDEDLMDNVETELRQTGCYENGVGNEKSNPYPVKNFDFLDACMKESVRSYSNFMQFRKVMKVGGFEMEPGKIIPQGELVCISPAESHHDEKTFKDPFVYKPSRWLSPDYWSSRAKEMSFVQWGFLRHRCYGEKFAQQFDKVAWARILTRCNVVNAVKGQVVPEPLWGSGFGTSFPKDNAPYWVKISPK